MLTSHPASSDAAKTDGLWRYIAYYGMSEIAQRATRLVTTVLIARLLLPVDLGIAASAITCFELIRSIANAGIGQAVIRSSDATMAGTCITAWRLMWIICASLTIVQTVAGAAIASVTGHPELFPMIAVLSGVYLMMPVALIQTYLVQRCSNHATIAKIATIQAVADNVLTIALALLGLGAWSIVLPKLLTCPIWMIGIRRAHPWRACTNAAPEPFFQLLQFSLPVIGSEIITAARLQLDKIMVGATLGVEALGIYYFVFNAGIGLTLSLTSALSNTLYPYFALSAKSPGELLQRLDRSLVHKALPISALVLLQAALAPIYVPLLFGAKWNSSAWLVAIMSASAATKLFSDASAQALRAVGSTGIELKGSLLIAFFSLAGLALGLCIDLPSAVVAFSFASGLSQLLFSLMARQWIVTADKGSGLLRTTGISA